MAVNKLILGDNLEILKATDADSVDLIYLLALTMMKPKAPLMKRATPSVESRLAHLAKSTRMR
jgi:hypothetical protein